MVSRTIPRPAWLVRPVIFHGLPLHLGVPRPDSAKRGNLACATPVAAQARHKKDRAALVFNRVPDYDWVPVTALACVRISILNSAFHDEQIVEGVHKVYP
jgi:hypothetical protein